MSHLLVEVLERAQALGHLGPGPVEAHIDHARAFLPHLPGVGATLDLGSGAGIPGLVIAEALPHRRVVLVDAAERRTAQLEEAVARLGFTHVAVVRGRAEEVAHDPSHRGAYTAVVARSFAPPPVVAECAAGFLSVGGRLVVSEPPEAPPRWDEEGLAQLGLSLVDQHLGPPALAVLVQELPCPERFPRPSGRPAKRPLWRTS